jgi:hypothetical protein
LFFSSICLYSGLFCCLILTLTIADYSKASLVEGRTGKGCTFSQLVSSFAAIDFGVSRHPVQGYVYALRSDGFGYFYSPNLAFLP